MKAVTQVLRIAIMVGAASACETKPPVADIPALVESLGLEPPVDLDVECPPVPDGAQAARFAGVFTNTAPILPDNPEFPLDFCPPAARFFARAEGRGNSTVFGEFVWREQYCAVPPGSLVAQGSFDGGNGDRLYWEAAQADSIPPPIPFATFRGTFTFTSGAGALDGYTGTAVLAATQLGDAAPGRPAGSTAAAICGWLRSPVD